MNDFKIIVSKEDCIPKCKVPTCKKLLYIDLLLMNINVLIKI